MDDYYDMKLHRSKKGLMGCFYSLVGLAVVTVISFFIGRCSTRPGAGMDTLSVDSVVITDTIVIEIHDTLPQEKGETVIKYVTIPNLSNSLQTGKPDSSDVSLCDSSVTIPVVQKVFSDDSTYTAYVSGLKYDQWPKLDSITVRQREVINNITKTITLQKKRSRWGLGIQAGYGYGLQSGKIEPYIGIGGTFYF